MDSGVPVDDGVIEHYNAFKLKKESCRYILYKIENDKIVIDTKGPCDATYEEFATKLAALTCECRYALFDLDVTSKDGRPISKIVFVAWIPDTASVKARMLYSSSKENLRRAFIGASISVNATDASELDKQVVLDKIF